MCLHGNYKQVKVINTEQTNKLVSVDACIADEIQQINNQGLVTLGCCCGHGSAGKIMEYTNGFGNWKTYVDPPHALINKQSVRLAKELGYTPYPYYYADGQNCGVWKIQLKTGCISIGECKEWHEKNDVTFEENQGVL